MFPGLSSRLEKDIRELYVSTVSKGEVNHVAKSINVIAQPNRKHAVFTGAAVFAKYIANHQNEWIRRSEWEEAGARVLDRM